MISETVNSTELKKTTPLKRLITALIIGDLGAYIGLLTVGSILLTLRVNEIDPKGAITSYGLIAGIGSAVAIFSMPIGGFISDRIRLKFGKRKTIIVVGAILGVLSLMCMAVSTNLLMLGFFNCLMAFGLNIAQAGYSALLVDQVPESKRGRVSGLLGVLGMAGMLIGLVLMSVMTKSSNIGKFGLISVILAIGTIIAVILIKDAPAERRNLEKSREDKVQIGKVISSIYPSPRKYPSFTWAMLTRAFLTLAAMSTTYNAMMFIQRYHYTPEATTKFTALVSFAGMPAMIIASLLGGFLSDKLRKQKIFIIFSAILAGSALLVYAFAPNFTSILIATIILQFGYGLYTGVDLAMVARILPRKEDTAKDMGIMNIARTIPQTIVPFIVPFLLGIGSWSFVYCFLAVCGLLGAITVLPIPDLSRKSTDDVSYNNNDNSINIEIN
ncbi:MFS transporter [Neobacillus vireti]|uniref:MFS transporter n=1 Tax=Neobacillus vireti TaxID=220686 RepID=UPI002FFF864A